MTHYTAADLQRISCDVRNVETVITFRNEQLLNLFLNEMQGQISDGYWENSRGTEWLWRNVMYRLGAETKVEVMNIWNVHKKSFGLPKDLWDVVGYRMWGDRDETYAGYKTEKEARAGWRELATAIYSVTELPRNDNGLRAEKLKAQDDYNEKLRALQNEAEMERKAVTGGYGVYLDPDNRKGYARVEIRTVPATYSYYFVVNYVFRVESGHLAEAITAIRNMCMSSEQPFSLLAKY